MNEAHKYELLSSMLENDIKVSTMCRLRYYAQMPLEDKKRLQENHIKRYIDDIVEDAESGEIGGSITIRAEHKEIYPYKKMIEDIGNNLSIYDIQITKVITYKRRNNYVFKLTIFWKKNK